MRHLPLIIRTCPATLGVGCTHDKARNRSTAIRVGYVQFPIPNTSYQSPAHQPEPHMIYALIAILSGLLLLADTFMSMSGFNRVIAALKPYETVIGIVALVAGVLNFFSLMGIALIMGG